MAVTLSRAWSQNDESLHARNLDRLQHHKQGSQPSYDQLICEIGNSVNAYLALYTQVEPTQIS